jgi:hypothetical protein
MKIIEAQGKVELRSDRGIDKVLLVNHQQSSIRTSESSAVGGTDCI